MQANQAFDEKNMLEDLLNSKKQRMDAYCTLYGKALARNSA